MVSRRSDLFLALLFLTACSGTGGDDAGSGTDAGPAPGIDAGGGGTDAGPGDDAGGDTDAGPGDDAGGDTDAGSDAGMCDVDAGPVPADVAACQAVVDAYRAGSCDPSDTDFCAWGYWRDHCATGRADSLRQIADCFTGAVGCGSFGQPGASAIEDCVRTARAAEATTASAASLDAFCLRCTSHSACPGGDGTGTFGVPPETLTDAQNATLLACLNATGDCDSAFGCLGGAAPGLSSCF